MTVEIFYNSAAILCRSSRIISSSVCILDNSLAVRFRKSTRALNDNTIFFTRIIITYRHDQNATEIDVEDEVYLINVVSVIVEFQKDKDVYPFITI